MRKSFVALGSAAVAGSLLLATPAMASQPKVDKQSCDSQNGTFANDQGTKSCTSTTTTTVTGPLMQAARPATAPSALCAVEDDLSFEVACTTTVAEYYQTYTSTATTTESQKGNGDVATTTTTALGPAQTIPVSCTNTNLVSFRPVQTVKPVAYCQALNLYP